MDALFRSTLNGFAAVALGGSVTLLWLGGASSLPQTIGVCPSYTRGKCVKLMLCATPVVFGASTSTYMLAHQVPASVAAASGLFGIGWTSYCLASTADQ